MLMFKFVNYIFYRTTEEEMEGPISFWGLTRNRNQT